MSTYSNAKGAYPTGHPPPRDRPNHGTSCLPPGTITMAWRTCRLVTAWPEATAPQYLQATCCSVRRRWLTDESASRPFLRPQTPYCRPLACARCEFGCPMNVRVGSSPGPGASLPRCRFALSWSDATAQIRATTQSLALGPGGLAVIEPLAPARSGRACCQRQGIKFPVTVIPRIGQGKLHLLGWPR